MKILLSVAVCLVVFVPFSGCLGGKDDGGGTGGEPDPAEFGNTTYDKAVGNIGHRVTGTLAGSATELDAGSAVSLSIIDSAALDGATAQDKAALVLDAKLTGFNVYGEIRRMTTAADLGLTGDFHGGVAQNIPTFGNVHGFDTGLPEANAFLWAAGLGQIKMNDNLIAGFFPVFVMVTEGVRGDDGAVLTAADEHDLEVHVLFPGSLLSDGQAIPGIGEFLYYYFERVSVFHLTDEEKAGVGSRLRPAEEENTPPVASGQVLVDGDPASSGVLVNNEGLKVTFDGSHSTDADGEVSVWVWTIVEANETGVFKAPDENATVLGETVEYNFTSPGQKLINLTVRDSESEIDNITLAFWVDHHRTSYGPPDTNVHAKTATSGQSCQPDLNCWDNGTIVRDGIQSFTFRVTPREGEGEIQNIHIEVYRPNEGPGEDEAWETGEAAGSNPAEVVIPGSDFTVTGATYTVWVWVEVGVGSGTKTFVYDIDMLLVYAPTVG